MIYTGLNHTGEVQEIHTHSGGTVGAVYGGINYQNPIFYSRKTLTGTSPLMFKGIGQPLSDYLISGNTTQNGTPTPEAPVDVVGCGEKTENLFDINDISPDYNCTINISDDIIVQTNTGKYARSFVRINNLSLDKAYTFKSIFNNPNGATIQARVHNTNDQVYSQSVETNAQSGELTIAFTPPTTSIVIKLYSNTASTIDTNTVTFSNIMLNEGPADLPYEPYGYKLPPTVNGAEYPIYLGQVPTTRRIRKLVLTGEETGWTFWNSLCLFQLSEADVSGDFRGLGEGASCDHLPVVSYADRGINTFWWSIGTIGQFVINVNSYDLTRLKAYLADNPITVWYVLATPETGIVNEPLHKIGDYADTISFAQAGVTIPTVAGTNTLTVNMTVQPSAVSITGNIKPTGYGQLLDVNDIDIQDSTGEPVYIQG